mmetsp:Transcript_12839/g.35960  ORF Transcript_12839/g.35960 Transcript_12839/m.35960 type:complete len:243 (-) Transcript_12839:1062-1790(-)
MRATPAQEKVPDRHLVGRELWDRPLVKELVEAQSTVKDVALMDAEDLFQVLGRQGVDTQDGLGKARRKLLDSLQDPIHERRPVTGVRNVLYKELHDMATLRRDRFVQAARDRHLDDWLLGQQAPTALLPSEFQLLHGMLEVNRATVLWARVALAPEIGKAPHGKVDFCCAAREVDPLDLVHKRSESIERLAGVPLIDQSHESRVRVATGADDPSSVLGAILKDHSRSFRVASRALEGDFLDS